MGSCSGLMGVLAMLFIASGCVERSSGTTRGLEPIGPIFGPYTAAQSFVLKGAPLVGMDVQLATYARRNSGTVTLRLRESLTSRLDLRTSTVEAANVADNALHRFRFEPLWYGSWRSGLVDAPAAAAKQIPASDLPTLAFVIESSAGDLNNAVTVWATRNDVGGSSTYDGRSQDLNLVFAPVYQESFFDLALVPIGRLAHGGLAPLISVLVLLVPGFLLATMFLDRGAHGIGLQLAAAPAFGVASASLLVLWSHTVGARLDTPSVGWMVAVAGVAIVAAELWRGYGGRSWLGATAWAAPPAPHSRLPKPHVSWPFAAAVASVAVGLLARVIALGDGPVPPGADAYHHTLITRLILERGGLPDSYLPYAPIDSFSYHFGFHAAAAMAAWATGQSALDAVEMLAPLLNACLAASVYVLACLGGLGRTTAAIGAVIVSLISPLPTWLLDVARYPQETALVILPVAAALLLCAPAPSAPARASRSGVPPSPTLLRKGEGDRAPSPTLLRKGEGDRALRAMLWPVARPAVGGAILSSSLLLTHYRVAILLVGLVALSVAWGLAIRAWRSLTPPGLSPGSLTCIPGQLWLPIAGLIGGGLLAAPWVVRLAQDFTLGIRGSGGRYAPEYYSLDRLGDALSQPAFGGLLLVATFGFALALLYRQPLVALLGIWALLQLAFSNPYWLPVPGAGAVDSVTVVSSLFFPASICAAFAVGGVLDWLRRPLSAFAGPAVSLALVAAAIWGGLQLPLLIHPTDRMADEGDLSAAEWVAERTQPRTKFLVNASVAEWQPDFVVPTDGGQWLPLLAGRPTTLLPLVYPAERGASIEEIERMERIARAVALDPGRPETLDLLRAAGVTHLYLGVRGGPIDERKVSQAGSYRPVYNRQGVSIYELVDDR